MKLTVSNSKIKVYLLFCYALIYCGCNDNKNNNPHYQILYYSNGNLKTVTEIHGNKANGTVTNYYENGKAKSLENWVNDTMQGAVFSFYSTGQLKEKANMKMGVNDGPSYSFFESGLIKEYRMWVSGKKEKYGEDYWDIPGRIKAVYFSRHDTLVYERLFDSTGIVIKTIGMPPTDPNPMVN